MREEVFLGGLGGQGVLLGGQMLARAGMDRGLNVSWFPIYSPEVRGGYLALVLALNAGLLAALASAELGLVEPVSLLAITALGTAAAWPLVARALESWLQTNSPQ